MGRTLGTALNEWSINNFVNRIKTGSNYNKPLFSIVFDDTRLSAYTGWFPFFNNLGLLGSLAVCTMRPDNHTEVEESMTWLQVKEMANAGWEIMSHSVNHLDMRELSDEELDYELLESKTVLESHGHIVNHFVYPMGYNNEKVRRFARKYYKSAREYAEPALNEERVNEHSFNPYKVRSFGERDPEDITTDEGMAACKAQIDIAYAENRWMVLTGHSHSIAKEAALLEIIQYVQALGIDILTYGDAFKLKFNYIESGEKFSVGENEVRIGEANGDALIATKKTAALGMFASEGNRESDNTMIGYISGRHSEGLANTFNGSESGYLSKLNTAIGIGYKSMKEAISGYYSIAIGYNSGYKSSGNNNIYAGVNAGRENTGDNCIGLGDKALYQNTKDHYLEIKQESSNVIPLIKGFFNTLALIQGCPSTSIADTEISNNTIHFYIDEGNDKLKVKLRYADGTIKTGDVCDLI